MASDNKSLDGSGRRPEENPSLPLDSTVQEGWRVEGAPQRSFAPPAQGADTPPAVGDTLGGYRILSRLGAGGMGRSSAPGTAISSATSRSRSSNRR